MNNNYLVSIIVPVYNCQNYLNKCLDSIVSQTYKNIEIILVNDGSTDNSLNILKKYQEKDNRIVLIDQPNSGGAAARNGGIKKSTGDYVYFVDSDDYIMPKTVEILLKELIDNNAEMTICYFSDKEVADYDKNYKRLVLNNKQLMEELFKDEMITSHLWRKLYPRKAFDKHLLPANKKVVHDMAADHLFLSEINKAVYIDAPLYIYTLENPHNLTNSNSKMILSSLNRAKVLIERLEFADKNYPDLSYLLFPETTMFLLSSYVKLHTLDKDNKSEISYIDDSLLKYGNRILRSNNVLLVYKIVVFSINKKIKPLIWLASKYYLNIFNK